MKDLDYTPFYCDTQDYYAEYYHVEYYDDEYDDDEYDDDFFGYDDEYENMHPEVVRDWSSVVD